MTKKEAIREYEVSLRSGWSGIAVVRWSRRFGRPSWTVEPLSEVNYWLREYGPDYIQVIMSCPVNRNGHTEKPMSGFGMFSELGEQYRINTRADLKIKSVGYMIPVNIKSIDTASDTILVEVAFYRAKDREEIMNAILREIGK